VAAVLQRVQQAAQRRLRYTKPRLSGAAGSISS
jgi:hypothetical protein